MAGTEKPFPAITLQTFRHNIQCPSCPGRCPRLWTNNRNGCKEIRLKHRAGTAMQMQDEDEKILSRDSSYPETPPRTWGRPLRLHSLFLLPRNTPTDVGKTSIFCVGLYLYLSHIAFLPFIGYFTNYCSFSTMV